MFFQAIPLLKASSHNKKVFLNNDLIMINYDPIILNWNKVNKSMVSKYPGVLIRGAFIQRAKIRLPIWMNFFWGGGAIIHGANIRGAIIRGDFIQRASIWIPFFRVPRLWPFLTLISDVSVSVNAIFMVDSTVQLSLHYQPNS